MSFDFSNTFVFLIYYFSDVGTKTQLGDILGRHNGYRGLPVSVRLLDSTAQTLPPSYSHSSLSSTHVFREKFIRTVKEFVKMS